MKKLRMPRVLIGLVMLLHSASPAAAQATSAPATGPAGEVSLRVQSVRLSRNAMEMQKRFPGRSTFDGGSPVSLQLMLSAMQATFLPPPRDALEIETFVDDTFQNLLAPPTEMRYQNPQPPVVSEDGRHVLLTINSGRHPADGAGRVFVRGTLRARVARGEPKVEAKPLNLTVGAQVTVGPFQTTLKSIADNGRTVTLTLSVSGDAPRIRKVRVLGKDGRQLNESDQTRVQDPGDRAPGRNEQPAIVHVNIPPGQEGVSLEYAFVEKVEWVNIPFEAQVDVGATKAGPVEASSPPARADEGGGSDGDQSDAARRVPRQGTASARRTWPPPPAGEQAVGLPPRRPPFDPASRPVAAATSRPKLERAAVDLFSLTVAKPAPAESKTVRWLNPPPPSFHPSGYTIARLLVSTPDASILSIPPDGISITRFEDDKDGRHETTQYASGGSRYGSGSVPTSPDGQQALVTVSLTSAPTPGATRCTIAGLVRARVARGEKTESGAPMPLLKGLESKIGPYAVTLVEVHQSPAITPASGDAGALEASIALSGPIQNIRSFEVVDAATGAALNRRDDLARDGAPARDAIGFSLSLPTTRVEKVIVRIRHFEQAEVVELPFEVSTGIGL